MSGRTSGGSATRATAGGRIRIRSGAAAAPDVRAAQIQLLRDNLQRNLRAARIRRWTWAGLGFVLATLIIELLRWFGA